MPVKSNGRAREWSTARRSNSQRNPQRNSQRNSQEMRPRDAANIVFANIHAPRVRHAGSAGLSAKHAEKVVKP